MFEKILKQYFGYDSFRQGQLEIIMAIANRQDTLAILPTGGGKSICFQIPALYFKGITIVISPLISLMKDQVDTLNRKSIPATYLNSSLSSEELTKRMRGIKALKYKLIYVAPERLNTKIFADLCKSIKIDFIAVDESHCVSQWGHDFRPAYLEIKQFIGFLNRRPIVAAFTATATKYVQKDIIKELPLSSPKKFTKTFKRDNLFFEVVRIDEAQKDRAIQNIASKGLNEGCKLVFCQSRKKTEEACKIAMNEGRQAAYYHAGLEATDRKNIQDAFMAGKYEVIASTNAFGMGVDKSDIREVYHIGFPASIEDYYQEAGRAGRDGKRAKCTIFYSMRDIQMKQRQLRQKYEDVELSAASRKLMDWETRKLKEMLRYLITDQCRTRLVLKYFGEKSGNCNMCDNCLALKC